MGFKDIATPLIARGIQVIPVESSSKRCRLPGWPDLATTDPRTVGAWHSTNPSANVGCVAKLDSILVLDCDVPGVPEEITRATGQHLPATFTVTSAGRRCPHYYFKHTPKSRKLGNRKLAGQWDLKAHNAYVVGPGSVIGTDGGPRTYDVSDPAPIAYAPDWLVDWIAEVTQPEKRNGDCRAAQPVSESFDIHAFLDHYGIEYQMKGNWYVCDKCPVSGRRHAQSTETGFFFDGTSFGFKCFAATCPGSDMTVGDVIKHLNKAEGSLVKQPYAGEIWSRPEAVPDPEVAGADWFVPLAAFAVREIPKRRELLWDVETHGCVLFSESVNQVFSFRGIGKSLFTMGLVNAVANGGEFLRYHSAGGARVLYCDGELPDSVLQQRFNQQITDRARITLMHAGSLPNQTFPKMSELVWQGEFIKRLEVAQPEVIVFDTLTACFRFDTNDAEAWERVNQFYITLRRKGYCVIVVHHAGKNGSQRGRTDGDDNLDLAIKLDAPKGWAPGDGCRFNLHYEKVRAGARLKEFSAAFDGAWKIEDPAEDAEIVRLTIAGKSVRAIANELEMSKSEVDRVIQKLRKSGALEESQ